MNSDKFKEILGQKTLKVSKNLYVDTVKKNSYTRNNHIQISCRHLKKFQIASNMA